VKQVYKTTNKLTATSLMYLHSLFSR